MQKTLQFRILIIEDHKTVATVIAYNLQKEQYLVDVVEDGEEGLAWAIKKKPDLILLDWILPSMTGIDICLKLRANPDTVNIPIIMISAKGHEFDKVEGLISGADDYISKPFSPAELIARVKAVFRRIRPAFSEKLLSFYDIEMNLNTYTVSRNGQEVKLAPIEFQVLQIMMEQPESVLTRQNLIDRIWGSEVQVDPRTVDVHITRLRKALINSSADDVDIIKTVRLVGYKLQAPRRARIVG